ncbi:YqfQ-like protein [Parageobacillus thermantarcticus]|uniref:YqfQ-like protein n=1 Tax=Parageobacillus thermantarcticus TaxID=186116 RepID=A0A1I0SFA5_9BACL|nr:VrrA/YqfQ family protein [Parageobacillus thermantarcticus]SFA38185.1 YqfQ-like protein [Parageobacillus thermantarcticus]
MIYNRPPTFPSPPMVRSFPFPPIRAAGPRPTFGGFLSRLFSRGQPLPPSSPWLGPALQRAASTSASTNAGGGFLGMLTNAQKMLGIAQNVMPMVQQYGPLIKNLPAMIRIWKELKTTDQEENGAEKNIQENKKKTSSSSKKRSKQRTVPKAKTDENKRSASAKTPRPSTPKLYI